MAPLAKEFRFRDGRGAANLERVVAPLPPVAKDRMRALLGASAAPEASVHYFARLLDGQPGAFMRMALSAAHIRHLDAVFAHSRFLAEEVLADPDWVESLPRRADLHRALSRDDYASSLAAALPAGPLNAIDLAAFRRRELTRIVVRDVLGYGALSDITPEISHLADAILHVAVERLRERLEQRHGAPGAGGLSVIALGKLGGEELNYSSDIDLMFIHGGFGETSGPDPVLNAVFFTKLCEQLTALLSAYTPRGLCYRVDLRLRPEGAAGPICLSVDAARDYYARRARPWELQMLIKARVAAGDPAPGNALLEWVQPRIYSSTLDFGAVEAVSEARHRINEKHASKRARHEVDVKLAPGGIRDIEFLAQCLQRLHGGREPWVRQGGTELALFRLHAKGLLSPVEYGRLAPAYQFLRTLEHRLQMLDDRQTHTLPVAYGEMDLLARRMPVSPGETPSADALEERLRGHLEKVREIYDRVVHAQRPPGADAAEEAEPAQPPDNLSANLARVIAQRAPAFAARLAASPLRHGASAFEHFLERMPPGVEWMRWLDGDPDLAGYLVDIFEHSPYLAEQLSRKPEWFEEVASLRGHRKPPSLGRPAGAAELRRRYNLEMLRIQAASICLRDPVFDTLRRASKLAGEAIAVCHRLASEEEGLDAEAGQLTVIVLGRLGMMEFDLGSDVDLLFVAPDSESPHIEALTRVATRMVAMLGAYTGDGSLFTADTRLRPNGSAGPLVQTESAVKEYFEHFARAWEGITYMKARAAAGAVERGTTFLNELQQIAWRRWGRSGWSRTELRAMRLRLQQDQGESNPLKAGPGGYYDIDFALMYLRLRGGEEFFPVLNTPSRIDVIERTGFADRATARFLLRAATLSRAVDHALRLSTGHARGQLPKSRLQLAMISELADRWTGGETEGEALPRRLAEMRARTRDFFDSLFPAQ